MVGRKNIGWNLFCDRSFTLFDWNFRSIDTRSKNFPTEIVIDKIGQKNFWLIFSVDLVTELWRMKFGRKNILIDFSVTKGAECGQKNQNLLFVAKFITTEFG